MPANKSRTGASRVTPKRATALKPPPPRRPEKHSWKGGRPSGPPPAAFRRSGHRG
jgi:hypothetical protein